MGDGVIRVDFQGFPIAGNRAIELAKVSEGVSQIDMGFDMSGV